MVSNETIIMVKQLKRAGLVEVKSAYWKMIYWFFSFPNMQFSLSDLVQKLKMSKTTANNTVAQLVKEGFLKIEVFGKVWRISCNQEHHYFHGRKISYNLALIYESNILEIFLYLYFYIFLPGL